MKQKDLFKDLLVMMNPYDAENIELSFWLNCLLIDPEAMCYQMKGEQEALYVSEPGKSCPTEILEKLSECNVEGQLIWKLMYM